MQFNLSVLTTVALATLAAAAPLEARTDGGSCNTGSCSAATLSRARATSYRCAYGAPGHRPRPITGQVGISCSPISVIGVGGSSCSAHPVCCQNNSNGGLISLGCIPISL
ncbi:fungal hydrophobin [Hymenopellis radicata]|nr:fungal hydrophobin [Hymenopellis radicata]